jgi:hypothetical protein
MGLVGVYFEDRSVNFVLHEDMVWNKNASIHCTGYDVMILWRDGPNIIRHHTTRTTTTFCTYLDIRSEIYVITRDTRSTHTTTIRMQANRLRSNVVTTPPYEGWCVRISTRRSAIPRLVFVGFLSPSNKALRQYLYCTFYFIPSRSTIRHVSYPVENCR